jgi:hypothetical protein
MRQMEPICGANLYLVKPIRLCIFAKKYAIMHKCATHAYLSAMLWSLRLMVD